jgi:hypothetical protein
VAPASRLPRRLASSALAAVVAVTVLGIVPAGAAAVVEITPEGCSTVSLTSPSPLTVHVTVADCGDPADTQFAVVADLTQDSTTESIKSWGSPAVLPVTTWIDQDVSVPAQGGYTLTITAFPEGGAAFPTDYKVSVLGGVAVTVSHPELRFRPGSMTASSWPAVVAWSNTSVNAANGYRIRIGRDGSWGAWTGLTGTSYRLRVSPGHTYQLQVRGRNQQGVFGPVMSSIVYRPRAYSEASSRITYAGGWRSAFDTRYWGSRARFTRTAGATARFTFTGAAAAIVAPLGPTRGSFRVYADGFSQRTVTTYSSGNGYKYVVYAIAWPQAGPHVVTIKVNGTAGHPRVDLDGILTLE